MIIDSVYHYENTDTAERGLRKGRGLLLRRRLNSGNEILRRLRPPQNDSGRGWHFGMMARIAAC
jgi:hypothetical protein